MTEAVDKSLNMKVCKWQGRVRCVYLNGYRIAGGKPWAGATLLTEFVVNRDDVLRALGIKGASAFDRAIALAEKSDV